MIHDPYTYVTLTLRPGDDPRLSVSFHTNEVTFSALVVESERPLLHIDSPEAAVNLSTIGGGPVTDADLVIARNLLDAATCYLADCERLHAAQNAPADQSGNASADTPTAGTAA